MAKHLLITDSDLDGVGCGILASIYLPECYIRYCTISTFNEYFYSVMDNAEEINKYDKVFITDLSIDDKAASRIDDYNKACGFNKIELIDHHKTTERLNAYDWAHVSINCTLRDTVVQASGTRLFWDHLIEVYDDVIMRKSVKTVCKTHRFVDLVRQYDTFEWKTASGDAKAADLNYLLTVYDRVEFINNMCVALLDDDVDSIISHDDLSVLKCIKLQKSKYFKEKMKRLHFTKYKDYNVAVAFVEQYVSEFGNYVCDQLFDDIDFIAMIIIDKELVSLRSTKDNVDVSAIAEEFGGGGHFHAAGFQITNKITPDIVKNLFTR